VVAAAALFSALEHGASLLPILAADHRLGAPAPGGIFLSAPNCGEACLPVARHHGRAVGKTTERGSTRGFDGHKLVRGRKRHILVDTLGLLIASRVELANVPDKKAGARLLAGLRALFPAIRTVMADAGHESSKLTRRLRRHEGWKLITTRRGQRVFKIKGLTWIVERSFA